MPDSPFPDKDPDGVTDESELQDLVDLAKQIPLKRKAETAETKFHSPADHDAQATPPTIENYEILECLGQGGMGTVWLANQEKPVRRQVALKLIRADIGSREAIARFEAERQALAMMNHPNIAQVLDAGTAEDNSPFFVMELVKGVPLTEYCDSNKLGIRERLELMLGVCDAIQHAHQKGIIHRDLKPSNVLVSFEGDRAVPKVIDFGLAKALEHTTCLTDKTIYTEFGKIVGTLQYMSPEQAKLDSLDIDTRTDIYSLGVMMYELLTGSTPLERDALARDSILNILERIRETDPPRPSARLSTFEKKISAISDSRKITPFKLQQILRGELDWIVMKAIEIDRTRRYSTASNLAEDIQRYLNDEPVLARPTSATYRVSKFVRKNKSLAISTVLIACLLLLATIVSGYFAIQAENARAEELLAKEDAIEQRDLAEDRLELANERLDLATSAIEGYYEGVANDRVLNRPELSDLRNTLLTQPAEFFEKLILLLGEDDSIESKHRLAKANRSLYSLQTNLGRISDAESRLLVAFKLIDELLDTDPDHYSFLYEAIYVRSRIIEHFLLTSMNDGSLADLPPEVATAMEDSLELSDRALTLYPDNHDIRAIVLRIETLKIQHSRDPAPESLQRLTDRAFHTYQGLDISSIPSLNNRYNAVASAELLAFYGLHQTGQNEAAIEVFSKLIAVLDEDQELKERADLYEGMMADMLEKRIYVQRSIDPDFDSLQDQLRIFEFRKSVLENAPTSLRSRHGVGTAAYSVANRYLERGETQKAVEFLNRSTDMFSEILEIDPSRVSAMMMMQMSQSLKGDALLELERWEEAIEAFEQVGEIDNYHGNGGVGETEVSVLYAKAQLGLVDEIERKIEEFSPEVKFSESFNLAVIYSVCASKVSDDEKKAELIERAFQCLEETLPDIDEGQLEYMHEYLLEHDDFSSLRTHPDFDEILDKTSDKLPSDD
ncbi:MAG: serine/threonine-protein kinase [Planctomycetota bacterium]